MSEIQEGATAPMTQEDKPLPKDPRAYPSIHLLATTSPQDWASEFIARVAKGLDEELVIHWFSNALIAGYDRGILQNLNATGEAQALQRSAVAELKRLQSLDLEKTVQHLTDELARLHTAYAKLEQAHKDLQWHR